VRHHGVYVRTTAELAQRYEMLASTHESCTALQQDVLPAARAALQAAQESYRHGKAGYLDVLDAQRTLFETELQLIESLRAYHHSVADVERLIGRSLGDVTSDGTATPEGTGNAN
jgi:cobalt-zinc-cadmium efflux system outer membrane protein